MSKSSDADFDLELHFLPAWAQQPPQENRYAHYAGEAGSDRRSDRRQRPAIPRRRPGPAEDQTREPKAARQHRPRRDERRPHEPRNAPPPVPLPELNVAFVPDDKGVDSLARQIKMTGRAYPLFEIAQMVLQKPERYSVTLSVKKKPEGGVIQPLFACALDDTVWLSEDEAIRWVLDKHFDVFYKAEKTQIEPPKGTYTFVAQCGMTGIILGPPNYHDYQNRLRKLHSERFPNLPFEVFKSRVKIVKDEAVVKKWMDEQSWKTEYVCLNLPEPLKLGSREAVEQHFREIHLGNIIKSTETIRITGIASRSIRSSPLARLVRQTWEDQRRFPLQVATILSQQFAVRGLQFFKVNKTVTHVAVARPHFLDRQATPVSEGVNKIVDFINAHPKTSRRDLIEALAPAPTPSAPETSPAQETPPAEAAQPAAPAPAPEPEPTPEQTAVIADLHWLIHQGHVIEFANGTLETAKKPAPRPPKPAPAPAAVTLTAEGAEAAPGAEQGGSSPTTEPGTVVSETTIPGTASSEVSVSGTIPTPPGTANFEQPIEPGERKPQPPGNSNAEKNNTPASDAPSGEPEPQPPVAAPSEPAP